VSSNKEKVTRPTHPLTPPHTDSSWHALDVQAVLSELDSDPKGGLSTEEAARRLEQYGPNTLVSVGQVPWYRVLLRQFIDVLIIPYSRFLTRHSLLLLEVVTLTMLNFL
jgi:magnesium-transporting ATPase (P-type)